MSQAGFGRALRFSLQSALQPPLTGTGAHCRESLVARFGGIPLQRQRTAGIADREPVRVDYP